MRAIPLVPSAFVLLGALAPAPGVPGARAARQVTVQVPFSDAGGLIVLDVRINGGPARHLVLDTGSRLCLIDDAVARELGIAARESTTLRGGAGTFSARVAVPTPRFRLAGSDWPVACEQAVLTDFSSVSKDVGARVDGIVGGDFFRGQVVAVDYAEHRLEVQPAEGFHYTGGGDTVPITVKANRPWLVARLSVAGDSMTPRELLIDTGSQDAVDDSLLLQSHAPLSSSAAGGLGAGFTVQLGRFAVVAIGRAVFHDVPGVVPAVPIVGGGLLRRFHRVIFDYGVGRLYLER